MLAAWMLYTVLVSLLVGLAGLAVERALIALERPIRWVWVLALPLALVLSAAPWCFRVVARRRSRTSGPLPRWTRGPSVIRCPSP